MGINVKIMQCSNNIKNHSVGNTAFKQAAKTTKPVKAQKGVALITVMLVFAVVSILAAALIKRLDQLINMTSHSVTQAQLRSYALGSETLIKYVLSQDKTPDVDALIKEEWSEYRGQPMQLEQYPIKEAYTRVWVIDAERCFNLNSILSRDPNPSPKGGNNKTQKQFQKLLTSSKLPSTLYASLKDWVDSDQRVSSAEDYYYLGLKPPYRAANQLLYDFSELQQVKGFNQKVMNTLATTSCVLPGIDTFALNINTASEALLKAIDPNAQKIIDQRKKEPIKDASSFNSSVNYKVKSSYFWVQVEVVLFGKRQVLSSLLHRTISKKIDVINRQWLPLSAPLVIFEQSKSS
ncbi:type II secretion system minor pseudopilin GspK [Zooshikella harenae]|uniref:Type II secretion system protein K n=1 Tax=Zooshikella harenae TaxID=2827238 RepID=A0ABS5ZGS8_9GAMM|nr:type II secretion system minor pseudopilin GspK [Zooshikella harenae]MBU2712197.1 type II secretion system minor pseudopilin GspK [Zooshikella harenae]